MEQHGTIRNNIIMFNYLDTDKSIIISSPAGSGKTEKLSRRYIALLQKGVDLERILAITFTDKAATEMKQRILNILKKEDEPLFNKLLEKMPLMRVSTIHSFCGTLIRRFSFEAEIDPNYRVEDDLQSSMLWEEILYEVLIDAAGGESGHRLLLQTIGEKGFRGLDYLRTTVDYLYQKNPFSLEAVGSPVIPLADSSLIEELRSWPEADSLIAGYMNFIDGPLSEDSTAIEGLFLTEKKEPRKRAVPLLKNFTDYRGWTERMHMLWRDKKAEELADRTARIIDIYKSCLRKYVENKRSKRTLDYSDLEYLAYRMLTQNPEWANILYAFDEKTDHILVDEFQDTNSFQWEIINKLTEEWRAGIGPKREEGIKPTMFLVGDEKQSIYYFRGANVEIFKRAKTKLELWLKDEFHYEEVRENYRCLPAIIDFTNRLFSTVMSGGEESYPWITRYGEFSACREDSDERGRVELILLDDEQAAIEETRQKEADLLARRIVELAGNLPISDRRLGQKRACSFRDMAILLRKRTHLKTYEEALRNYNIPFVAVKGIGFYQEPEVAMLRSFIYFLSNPGDDYSLYVLLKSPLFSLNEESILTIINGNGSSLFSKLSNLLKDSGNSSNLKNLNDILMKLNNWLSTLPHTPLSELIEDALVNTGAWSSFHEAQRRGNIKKFIRIIEDLESAGRSLLKIRDFLEHTLNKESEPKANVNTEGMDAVKIMTIHASKGLEFPIVFIPGIEEPFLNRAGENLIYEEDGKQFFKSAPEPSIRKLDRDFLIHQAKEEEEQKRLFYVAATRAEEALLISGQWSTRTGSFLSLLRHGIGLEKEDEDYIITPELEGLSILREEDIKNIPVTSLKRDKTGIGSKPAEYMHLKPFKRTSWKSVTGSVDIRRRHGKDWIALGEIIHRLFELISKGLIGEEEVNSRVERMLGEKGFYKEDKEDKLQLIKNQISVLKGKGIWQEIIIPRKDSYSELPFILESGNAVYSGRIDRVISDNGGYNVYDYKTFPVKEKEIPLLLREYSSQLNIYKKAIMKIFDTSKVKAFVIFSSTGEIEEVC